MICKSRRSRCSNSQGMNGQDAQALEEGGIASSGTQRQVRGRTGRRTTQCRWQCRGGRAAAAEGEPEVTGYTILQPELQERRGGPRSPGSAPFPDPLAQGSLTFGAAAKHRTWASAAPQPLSALAAAGRNAGEGSQSAGLRGAPGRIPRSRGRGTSLAPSRWLRPAPRLCHAPLERPAPILMAFKRHNTRELLGQRARRPSRLPPSDLGVTYLGGTLLAGKGGLCGIRSEIPLLLQ